MDAITVGTRTLTLPSLIPSISSFETQLSPAAALRLQTTLREPVSLVSAFDLVADQSGDLRALCREYRKGGVLFLDSGGYEHPESASITKPINGSLMDFWPQLKTIFMTSRSASITSRRR